MSYIEINDSILNAYAAECAKEIAENMSIAPDEAFEDYRNEMYELAHEHADSSEWVIYTARAHALCANCKTDNGEAFLEEIGYPDAPTYDGLASTIAYGELVARIQCAIEDIIEQAGEG